MYTYIYIYAIICTDISKYIMYFSADILLWLNTHSTRLHLHTGSPGRSSWVAAPILQHLGRLKPYKTWDVYHKSTGAELRNHSQYV